MMLFISGGAIATPREDAIKSGFIYNFARYSQGEWFDATLNESYNICSFNTQFSEVASKTLKGLTIKTRPVVINLLTSEASSIACHTLFISASDIEKWENLMVQQLLSKSMLVGEFQGFLRSGGHINFFIVGGKVRFEIDPVKLKLSGINMSSKVLRLGRIHQ